MPVDSLAEIWTLPMGEVAEVPYNIAWIQPDSGDAARLAVIETKDGQIHTISARGERGPLWSVGAERFPYLAGVVGDTVVVFSRGVPALDWVTAGGVARSIPAPEGATAAFADSTRIVVRLGGGPSEVPAALARLDARGAETARYPIAVDWRASGFVRAWGDSLLALSGYRPVADVLTPRSASGATLDTLAFTGFDSPQLVRSYQFMAGDVDEPPLLAPSAQAIGDRLYVLNVRTERIRVDIYDRAGRLQRVLQSAVPTAPDGTRQVLSLYPGDLAVRELASGEIEIAVLMKRDRGLLQRADSEVVLLRTVPPLAPEAGEVAAVSSGGAY